MHRILEGDVELLLLLEMIRFLSGNGEQDLFRLAVKKALPLLESQEELMEVAQLTADFYRRLDEDEKETRVQKILNQSKKGPLHSSDLNKLQELLAE